MSMLNDKNIRNFYKKKIGIKEIAQASRLSLSTVSRALRGDPATNSKTAKKIIDIAEELGYYPDLLAKGLREKKTNTIGVIFNDMNNPFYAEILSTINMILNKNNFSMLVSYSNWEYKQERKNIINMLSRRVDGIIISPIVDKSDNIKLLIKNNISSVLIDCYPYFKEVNYVYINHKKASALAAQHLIDNGHKDIMLIIMPNYNFTNTHFLKGYKETLKKNKIDFREDLVIKAPDISISSGYKVFSDIIKRGNYKNKLKFTAIISISDLIALGIYKAAFELGLNIPGDYSIVGYDNIDMTGVIIPPLTTVQQPRKMIGRLSTEILIEKIKNDNNHLKKMLMEPEIVIRKSVSKI